MTKQLAIMKKVKIGTRDMGRACMWFAAYIDESSAALQVLNWMDTKKVIEDANVYDFKSLEGHACWVECDQDQILFLKIAKI